MPDKFIPVIFTDSAMYGAAFVKFLSAFYGNRAKVIRSEFEHKGPIDLFILDGRFIDTGYVNPCEMKKKLGSPKAKFVAITPFEARKKELVMGEETGIDFLFPENDFLNEMENLRINGFVNNPAKKTLLDFLPT